MNGLYLLILLCLHLTNLQQSCPNYVVVKGDTVVIETVANIQTPGLTLVTTGYTINGKVCSTLQVYRKICTIDELKYKTDKSTCNFIQGSKTQFYNFCVFTLKTANERFVESNQKSIYIDCDSIEIPLTTTDSITLESQKYKDYENYLKFDNSVCDYRLGTIKNSCPKIEITDGAPNMFLQSEKNNELVYTKFLTVTKNDKPFDIVFVTRCSDQTDDKTKYSLNYDANCLKIDETYFNGTCKATLNFGFGFSTEDSGVKELNLICTPKELIKSPKNPLIDLSTCSIPEGATLTSSPNRVTCVKNTEGDRFLGTCDVTLDVDHMFISSNPSQKSLTCDKGDVTPKVTKKEGNPCACPRIPFNKVKATFVCQNVIEHSSKVTIQINDPDYIFDHKGIEKKRDLAVTCTNGVIDYPIVILKWKGLCDAPKESEKITLLTTSQVTRGSALEFSCKTGDTKTKHKAMCTGFTRFDTPVCVKNAETAEAGSAGTAALTVTEIIIMCVFLLLTVIVTVIALIFFWKMGMFSRKNPEGFEMIEMKELIDSADESELIILR